MSQPYADTAQLYYQRGWQGTLPIRGKWPPPKGWTGTDGPWPSFADIWTWCEQHPGHNVGLRLPVHVVGIDVDHYGNKPGAATLAEHEERLGRLPPTWITTSREDGISGIRLFTVPAGLLWPGELKGGGVEVIRTGHRYAMVWPSIHPDTERVYRWLAPDGHPGADGFIPGPDDLPNLPEAWVAALTGGQAEADITRAELTATQATGWLLEHGADGNPCHMMAKALQRARLELTAGGSRHEAAMRGTARLALLIAEGHLGGLIAIGQLHAAFCTATAGENRPGEWERMVDGAVRIAAARTVETVDPCTVDTHLTLIRDPTSIGALALAQAAPEPVTDETPNQTVTSALASRMFPGGPFVLDVPEVTPAIWGEAQSILWAQGESLIIAAGNGAGKTTLAGQIVRGRLGLGGKLLDLPIVAGERCVLYLAMDRPQQIARSLRRHFIEPERAILDERLKVWKGPPPSDLAKMPELLLELVQAANADTVVIDSLKDAAIGLSEDEVGAGWNRARQLVIAANCQMLELHHNVKRNATGGDPATIADVYGSAWITAGVGSVILLVGAPGDPIVHMRQVKQPAEEVGPYYLEHDHEAGLTTIHEQVDLLDHVRIAGPTTAFDAAKALFETDKPSRAEKQKAVRRLNKLVEAGHFIKIPGAAKDADRYAPAPVLTLDRRYGE